MFPMFFTSLKQVHYEPSSDHPCAGLSLEGKKLKMQHLTVGRSPKLMLVQVSAKDGPNISCESTERKYFEQRLTFGHQERLYFATSTLTLTSVHPTLAEGSEVLCH